MASLRKKIRLGIIGCGRVAEERHLPALQYHRNAEIIAAADTDEKRLNRLAGLYDIKYTFTDYRKLLDIAPIDAVGVLTPTPSHAKIGLSVLDAGKHLLVEKPMALNLAECDALIACQKDAAGKAVVGFNLRWHRFVRDARRVIRAGRLGRIKAVRSVYTHYRSGENAPDWHRRKKCGGGVTLNESIHHFDLWRYLLDTEVDEIFSFSRPSSTFEDETMVTQAILSNDVFATGIFTLKTSPNCEIEIFGEKGRLYLSLYRFDGFHFFPYDTYPGNILDRAKKCALALGGLPTAIPIIRKGGDFSSTFYCLWGHFLEVVTKGENAECSLIEGKRALQIALSALESAARKESVKIEIEPPYRA